MSPSPSPIRGLAKKLLLASALTLLPGFFLVGTASAAIIYSGADRNVTYSQFSNPGTFSLFDSAETWDDISLNLTVTVSLPFFDEFRFSSLLSVHGNYVQFAIAAPNSRDIVRHSASDLIDSSAIFSDDTYQDFSNYYVGGINPGLIDSGEFRNATGYTGIRMINGEDIYYGWIQVSVTNYNNSSITGVLIDWAYESTPGVAIQAGAVPEPSTALLFLGATLYGAAFLSRRRA